MGSSFSQEYSRLAHAVQSGVAVELNNGSRIATPKYLRTGLNLVMRDLSSLCDLLIQKGLLTQEELEEAILKGVKEEIKLHEQLIEQRLGKKIKLL